MFYFSLIFLPDFWILCLCFHFCLIFLLGIWVLCLCYLFCLIYLLGIYLIFVFAFKFCPIFLPYWYTDMFVCVFHFSLIFLPRIRFLCLCLISVWFSYPGLSIMYRFVCFCVSFLSDFPARPAPDWINWSAGRILEPTPRNRNPTKTVNWKSKGFASDARFWSISLSSWF